MRATYEEIRDALAGYIREDEGIDAVMAGLLERVANYGLTTQHQQALNPTRLERAEMVEAEQRVALEAAARRKAALASQAANRTPRATGAQALKVAAAAARRANEQHLRDLIIAARGKGMVIKSQRPSIICREPNGTQAAFHGGGDNERTGTIHNALGRSPHKGATMAEYLENYVKGA